MIFYQLEEIEWERDSYKILLVKDLDPQKRREDLLSLKR